MPVRYYVTLAGRTLEVDLTGAEPRIEGEAVTVEMARIPGTATRHLLVDGRSHDLIARKVDRHHWDVHLDAEPFRVEVVDERTRAIRAMVGESAVPRGPRPVRAPMPGLIVRVNVQPGERVTAGQSVAIIEAMKMENDLKADGEGVVAAVRVEAGQPVEKGTVLVEFRPEDADG